MLEQNLLVRFKETPELKLFLEQQRQLEHGT